jgi:hypothetical protein
MDSIFRIRITPKELDAILLKHLIVDGQITEREVRFFRETVRIGSKLFVEFSVPTIEEEAIVRDVELEDALREAGGAH